MHLTADSKQRLDDRLQAWTRYWRTGALHSCPTSYPDNYDGVIGSFWREVAPRLPPRARVIDLATGNGAIPRLLIRHGRTDLNIDAIDAAEVSDHQSPPVPRLRFHSGIRMERLPFPTHHFDVVSSQFGIEYADHPQALEEVLRVLKPSGQIHWVMHHRDSVFVRVARRELEHLEWSAVTDGFLDAAIALAPSLLRVRAGLALEDPVVANAARDWFNQVQVLLDQRIRRGQNVEILQEIRATVHMILLKENDPVRALQAYRRELEYSRLRCKDLCIRAFDQADMTRLADWFHDRRPNLRVDVATLSQIEGLLAWGFRAIST